MALTKNLKYAWKFGEFSVPDESAITVKYVGGSPVNVSGGSYTNVDGDWLIEKEFTIEGTPASDPSKVIGIAMYNYKGVNEPFVGDKNLGTVLFFPVYAELYKGADEDTAPFDTTRTYNVGDVLVPSTTTVGADTYAIWTNDVSSYTGPVYGRVIAVSGTGADTLLVVIFQPITVL